MPFLASADGGYVYVPQAPRARGVFFLDDDNHADFRHTAWCVLEMFYSFQIRVFQTMVCVYPVGWEINENARCYVNNPDLLSKVRRYAALHRASMQHCIEALKAQMTLEQRNAWFPENDEPRAINPFNDLDIPAPPRKKEKQVYSCPKDIEITKIEKRRLFMPYDSMDEARLRLRNSVITIGGKPAHVYEITGRNTLVLNYRDTAEGELKSINYLAENDIDLSPLPARYYCRESTNRNAHWVFRLPIRGVYQQGGSRKNTFIRRSGDLRRESVGHEDTILRAYAKPNTITGIDEGLKMLGTEIRSVPLSDHVAIYAYNRKLGVEYHGLLMDTFKTSDVSNGVLKLELDSANPLMIERLAEVGIKAA